MIVVSTKEFRDNQKKFLDMAKNQRVIIKRKSEFLEIVCRGNVIPDSVSPSNDPYFDNPQNIEYIEKGLEQARQGKTVKLTPSLREELFGDL